MKKNTSLILLAVAVTIGVVLCDNGPQLLSGVAVGGSLSPSQKAPVDPSRVTMEILGNRNNGYIHIHAWGPNTTTWTEYGITALGNNAFDYDLYLIADNGDIYLDYLVNNPGPYNFGVVKSNQVTGKWHPRKNGAEKLEIHNFYNLRTERVSNGALRIAEVDLENIISGSVTKEAGVNKLRNGHTYLSGPAVLNVVPSANVGSPYQFVTGVGVITTEGESINTAYRALSVSANPKTFPVDPYLARAEIRDAYIDGGNLYGTADFYTVAPEGYALLQIYNKSIIGYATTLDSSPNSYLIEKLQAFDEAGNRWYGEHFHFFY